MATENGENNAPDSWDQDLINQDEGDPGNDLSRPLLMLNVNAPEFVPGQNPYATAFVMPQSDASDAQGTNSII